jgi:hypothetical protein
MITGTIYFSNHAVKQMFQRDISIIEVEHVLEIGEIVTDYPDDKPFPSSLILAFYNKRPLHVLYSIDNNTNNIIIITTYEPSNDIWENDFKTRKMK